MGTLRRDDTLAEVRINAFKISPTKSEGLILWRPPSYRTCLLFGQTRQATLSTQSLLLLMPQKSKLTLCVCIPQSAVSNSSGLESLRNFPQPYNVSQSTMRNRLQRARNCILFAFLRGVPCCRQRAVGLDGSGEPFPVVPQTHQCLDATQELRGVERSAFRAADILSIFGTQIYASPPWGLSVSTRCKHSPSSCE